MKWIRFFIPAAGVILLAAASSRFLIAAGDAQVLALSDPMLGIPLRYAVIAVGAFELVVALICLFGRRVALQLDWLALLATSNVLYWIGLLVMRCHPQGTCVGGLTDPLHIHHGITGYFVEFIPFALVLASYAAAVSFWFSAETQAAGLMQKSRAYALVMGTKSRFQPLARRLCVLTAGVWVSLLVVSLVGGRELRLWSQRPAEERALAQAYGDTSLFYGAPQSDRTGEHLTFVKTTDVGFGVFLCDTATGQKQDVRVPTGEHDLDYPFFRVWPLLRVWPWSPDDSSFAYSDNKWLFICDGQTGQSTARSELPTPVSSLTWLNPESIRCMAADGKLYQMDRQRDGTWKRQTVTIGEFALRSMENAVAVMASQTASGEDANNAVDGDPTTSWFSGKADRPAWLQYQFSGLAWAITRYTLTSSSSDAGADPRDWQLLGTDDGTNWTVLDARTNETFANPGQTKHYEFANETPYWFYRLKVTATSGSTGNGARLAEFQLFSRDAPACAAASLENQPNETATAAFDGSANTKWFDFYDELPTWLQYEFGGGAAAALSAYSLTSGADFPTRDPGDWEFQASNDGVKWTMLDTRTGESFESRRQTKSYSFKNATPYRFYRLSISQNHGTDQNGYGGVQLAELGLGLKELLAKISNPASGLALRTTNAGALQLAGLNLRSTQTNGAAAAPAGRSSNNSQNGVMGLELNPFANAFSLNTMDARTIAWGQSKCIWSLDLNSNSPQPLLDIQTAMPPNTTLRGFRYSRETGQFLLVCDTAGRSSMWRFDPNNAPSKPVKIADGVSDAVWTSGGGWLARQNNNLMVANDATSAPIQIMPGTSVDGFAVSPDGRQLFIQGAIKDEVAPGMWQYDLASSKLNCVAPYSDKPLVDAKHESFSRASLRLPSGETVNYVIFSPNDASKDSHRKRPLVLGDTIVNGDLRGARGRIWIPALNAAGAYVVIVTRSSWWGGIEKWSGNVRALYDEVLKTLPIDKKRVFLFGTSAEAGNTDDLITQSPGLWRGVIYINPAGQFPDFSKVSLLEQRPRIYISAGSLEGEDQYFKRYQEKAIQTGAIVQYVIAPGEAHSFMGNAAQLQRTKDIMRMLFDE